MAFASCKKCQQKEAHGKIRVSSHVLILVDARHADGGCAVADTRPKVQAGEKEESYSPVGW
jgi:hypothetical protein